MTQDLLTPFRMGSLELPNRIVMAPMTRNRGDNPENKATDLVATYYAQRASAGLIISEGTFVSRQGIGFINVPGLYMPRADVSSRSFGMSAPSRTLTCRRAARFPWPPRRSTR